MTGHPPLPLAAGWRRGVIELRQDFAPSRLPGQLLWPVVTLATMYAVRDREVGGVQLGTMMFPSVLGVFAILGAQLMVQHLAADREDGTLLRARSTPRGIAAYLLGKVTLCSLTVALYLAMIAVPGALMVPGLAAPTVVRLAILGWVLLLGMAVALSWGAVVGALVPSVRAASYVALLLMGLIAASGVFYPVSAFPGWLQATAPLSPVYWVGHGMRAALLPDAYAAAEPGGVWRLPLMSVVLGAWAVVGVVVAPRALRAMTRKESGTRVASRQGRALDRQV